MPICRRSARTPRCAAFLLVLSLTTVLGALGAGCHSKEPEGTSQAYRDSFKGDLSKMPKEFRNHPTGPPVTLPSGVPENVKAQVQAQASQAMQAAQTAQAAQTGH